MIRRRLALRRLALRLLAPTLAGLLAACSIGPQAQPRELDIDVDRTLPINPTEPTDATDATPIVFTSTVYLVSSDSRLVPVARELRAAPRPDDRLRALFAAVVDGPTDDEIERGLRSLVPPTTSINDATLAGTSIMLDLSSSFASIGGPAELLAVGQMVLTATTFPGIQDLVLLLDGTATALPLPDGSLTTEPVTLRQFTDLLDPLADPDDDTGGAG